MRSTRVPVGEKASQRTLTLVVDNREGGRSVPWVAVHEDHRQAFASRVLCRSRHEAGGQFGLQASPLGVLVGLRELEFPDK